MKKTFIYLLMGWMVVQACSDPAAKIKLDTRFQTQAPHMTEPTITQVSNQAFRIEVTMDPQEIRSDYHAIGVGEAVMVFRDDGRKGDQVKKDGIYSLLVEEDPLRFRSDLEQQINRLKTLKNRNTPLYHFVGRHAVPITAGEIERFDQNFKQIRINNKLLLPRFFLNFPPPVAADFISLDSIMIGRSVLITDTAVIEDPSRTFDPCTLMGDTAGAWTFNQLIKNIANGTNPELFVKTWLREWFQDKNINGDVVPRRAGSLFTNIIRPWLIASNPGIPVFDIEVENFDTLKLDLHLAPFKLIAIVNRMDLGGTGRYGAPANAGEGRFVFQVVDGNCTIFPFLVILEYGLPVRSCTERKNYAQKWASLSLSIPGTPDYNDSLEALTRVFSDRNQCSGEHLNGTCLNQLRTNEIAIGSPWELREFVIDSSVTPFLISTTVKQEPQKTFNRKANPPADSAHMQTLRNYVQENEQLIKNDNHTVPLSYEGQAFLGGKGHTENNVNLHFWDAGLTDSIAILNDTARHHFSLNTCSGCHGGETQSIFTHIALNGSGGLELSGFLTGDTTSADGLWHVNDVAGRGEDWTFNDLERRKRRLHEISNQFCGRRPSLMDIIAALRIRPIKMVH